MDLSSLPNDVCINIMEYTRPHICPTQRDRERLQKHVIQRQIYNKKNSPPNETYSLLYDYLQHDSEHIFHVLSTCKCCLRHQRNRPIAYNQDNPILPMSTMCQEEQIGKTRICACPCRHIMRAIAHHFHDG